MLRLSAHAADDAQRGGVRGLGQEVRAVGERSRNGVVRADPAPDDPPEAALEEIWPVHRIVLSRDVGGDAAEVQAFRALLLRSDDALPPERGRGVALSRCVVR